MPLSLPYLTWKGSGIKLSLAPPCSSGPKKTYNTRDSLVVTDPTTSLAVAGLSMGERTGSRAFQRLWSYVKGELGFGVM